MTSPQEFFALFDQVRIIHLTERADRQRDLEAEFHRLGVAIDGRHIAYFPAIRPADEGPFPTRGAHGCFLSHLGLLRAARSAGARSVLILEDDLNFARDFADRLAQVLSSSADIARAGLCHFGYDWVGEAPAQKTLPAGLCALEPEQPLRCAHFMSVDGAALQALVPYLEAMLARPSGDPEGGPMHVDGAYNWFRRSHPEMAAALWVPPLGYQRSSRTDIHRLSWLEALPGSAVVLGPLRALKNKLRSA
jgi:hypothetical protein